jgi:hypothetical protein
MTRTVVKPATCSTCFYWTPTNLYAEGLCKRHAPIVTTDRSASFTLWPSTKDDAWCGDYLYKEPEDDNDD